MRQRSKVCHVMNTSNGYQFSSFSACLSEADVMFVVDSSSSIISSQAGGQINWQLMLDFIVDLVEQFDIGRDNVRVGLLTYNETATVRWYLDEYFVIQDLVDAINALPKPKGNTNIAAALRETREELMRNNRGHRDDTDDIVILISDGKPNKEVDQTLIEADLLKGEGAEIITVGITDAIDEAELKAISTDGTVALAKSFDTLDDILTKVSNLACKDQPEARLGEFFSFFSLSYSFPFFSKLHAHPNFYHIRSKIFSIRLLMYDHSDILPGCSEILDMVFVVDASGSIGLDNWELVIDFINAVIDGFTIGPDDTQVGMVVFSTNARIEFNLTDYLDEGVLKQAVESTAYDAASTNLAGGIELMRTVSFTADAGERPDARNVAVIINRWYSHCS